LKINALECEEDVNTFAKNISKAVKNKTIRENPGLAAIADTIKQEIEDFRPLLPLVSALRNAGMQKRHWQSLSQQLQFDLMPDDNTTLDKVRARLSRTM